MALHVNPHRGESLLALGGRDHRVWFGWPGIALLQQEFGQEFDIKISQALSTLDLPSIAKIVAIGVRESWPGVTADQISDLSPPIAQVTDAISTALKRTFHGAGEVAEKPRANFLTPLRRLLRTLLKQG